MHKPEELIRRLKPVVGGRADSIWHTYLASDREERQLVQHSLENLHSHLVDDYRQEKLVLTPPSKFEELYGEYPAGMVYYADKPLYPFAFLERELLQHIGVFGRTGAGKTCFVKGLLLGQLRLRRPFIVFDWKTNYTDLVAGSVLLFVPGSESFPFHFNPLSLDGIPPEYRKTYQRQVIELFLDTYFERLQLLTVQGVEYLLLIALDDLQSRQESVSFRDIYSWLSAFEGRQREMDWKVSALDMLYKLTTGPLGSVMQGPAWQVEWLAQQQAVIELSNVGSSKDKTFFIRSLMLRFYYHFLHLGTSDKLRLLMVIEEAHNVLLRRDTSETIMELVLRQVREYGVGICVVDQHPSLVSLPALGTYSTVCFNLRLRQDRVEMTSALLLRDDQSDYLGRLPSRMAIVKLQDRFMTPFLVRSFHIPKRQPSMDELKERMAKLLPAPTGITESPVDTPDTGLDGCNRVILPVHERTQVIQVFMEKTTARKLALVWEEVFLAHAYLYPLMPTVERYVHLGINKFRGQRYRTSLLEKKLALLESVPTSTARIKLLVPTLLGFQWLKGRGFSAGASDKEGSLQHRYWKRRLWQMFSEGGFTAQLEVGIGAKQSVDLVVSNGGCQVAVEIETGINPYEQIARNVSKCVEHGFSGVVSLVLEAEKAARVRKVRGSDNILLIQRVTKREYDEAQRKAAARGAKLRGKRKPKAKVKKK